MFYSIGIGLKTDVHEDTPFNILFCLISFYTIGLLSRVCERECVFGFAFAYAVVVALFGFVPLLSS